MTGVWTRRGLCAAAISMLVMITPVSTGIAGAIEPPVIDPGAVPDPLPLGPGEPLRQEHQCIPTGLTPGTDIGAPPAAQAFMDLPAMWRSAGRGAGQTIVMVDTGVNVSPRLPHMHGGGDYVDEAANGLQDCDSHGTVVASILGHNRPKPMAWSAWSLMLTSSPSASPRQHGYRPTRPQQTSNAIDAPAQSPPWRKPSC